MGYPAIARIALENGPMLTKGKITMTITDIFTEAEGPGSQFHFPPSDFPSRWDFFEFASFLQRAGKEWLISGNPSAYNMNPNTTEASLNSPSK